MVQEFFMELKWIRRLYDWVLHWADTPYSLLALGLLSFAEASFFPVPPDVLLIAMVLGNRAGAFRHALVCSGASIAGALLGYGIGHFLWWNGVNGFTGLAHFFFDHVPGITEASFYHIQDLYHEWDFWIIFTAGFTPIPFKLFTVTGGAFDISLPMFLVASTVSRSARFYLVTWLLWYFGEPVRGFIDRYFNWLALGFTVLLIGGFLLVKVLL